MEETTITYPLLSIPRRNAKGWQAQELTCFLHRDGNFKMHSLGETSLILYKMNWNSSIFSSLRNRQTQTSFSSDTKTHPIPADHHWVPLQPDTQALILSDWGNQGVGGTLF